MRLFALEKFSGTFETLMTTPVTDRQVVAAKFTAALVFYTIMWLPLLACIFIVTRWAIDSAPLDPGILGSTFAGILLLGCVFLSGGCFASAVTRHQAVAAIITLAFGFALFTLSFLADRLPSDTWQSQVLSFFALRDHMTDFVRGSVDTRPVVFCLSLTFFFLFLTLRVVESRRWK
jgi:ABC-2 type transport system permease protein